MEITVVVALIAVMALLSVPGLQRMMDPDAERDVQRELENVLMAAREESILSRTPMALVYNLAEGTYGTALLTADGRLETASDPLSIARRLPRGMRFLDVSTPREDRSSMGVVFSLIWPTGWIEPTVIHLQEDGGRQYTLVVEPLSGAVRLADGYLIRRRVSS
jgi:type II secretory pathway pseudopilin PulG